METVIQITIRMSDLTKVIELVKKAPIESYEEAKDRIRLVEVLNNNVSNAFHISRSSNEASDLSQQ